MSEEPAWKHRKTKETSEREGNRQIENNIHFTQTTLPRAYCTPKHPPFQTATCFEAKAATMHILYSYDCTHHLLSDKGVLTEVADRGC